MRTVTLTNLTPSMVVLNLPAHVVPERSLAHRGSHQPQVPKAPPRVRPGEAVKVPDQKRQSGSVTLAARGTPGSVVTGLPPSVLQAPEVKAAIDARRIKREIVLSGDDAPKLQPSAPRAELEAPANVKVKKPHEPRSGGKDGAP